MTTLESRYLVNDSDSRYRVLIDVPPSPVLLELITCLPGKDNFKSITEIGREDSLEMKVLGKIPRQYN